MLKLQNISFAIDGKPLFNNASATIPTGYKTGIVGRNGTGKTSLFRLIRGEWALDSGSIEVPAKFRIGGVDQEAPASDISLLDTVLAADVERQALMSEAEIANDPTRVADIHLRLVDIDAYSAESRAATILSGLGFDQAAQARPCNEFSGGWRMRVALAAVLFSQPDLLLLDEPTNYLDLEGTVWLENFLAKYSHTVLVISHDRELLNTSVSSILHLTGLKLHYYTGKYDQFDNERRLKLEQQQSMKRKQDAQRAHIQSFVDRFRYKASKARQAQSRLKQLEKMQPIAALSENAVASFTFPTPQSLPAPLMTFEKGSVGYNGKPVLSGLDLRLDQDDRIALLGANGEGKTTLSKLFADRLPLIDGSVAKSSKLRIGFFSQHQLDELVLCETPLWHMMRLRPAEMQTKIRSRLGAAGIGTEIVENPVERLSGGQKARLLMAMATIDAPHILILDEPTNHLDIESREALVHALNDYRGAVILVSHDPHLVETVADTLWILREGKVSLFDGDMDDYKRLLLSKRGGAQSKTNSFADTDLPVKQKPGTRDLSARERRHSTKKLRMAVSKCERKIKDLQAQKDKLQTTMAKSGFYGTKNAKKIADVGREMAAIDRQLVVVEETWLEAQEALELASEH